MVRIELMDFPKPWFLFYAAVTLSLGYLAFAFFRTWRGWSRGMQSPPVEPGNFLVTAKIWLFEVFLHRQLYALSFSRWLVHILIFYGFIGLALLPVVANGLKAAGYLELSSAFPRYYLRQEGYVIVKLWGDSFGLMLLLGIVLAALRRFVLRPAQQSSNQADAVLLAFLLLAVLTGFSLEGLRLALLPPQVARWSFVGRLFAPPGDFTLAQLRPWLTACWTFHVAIVCALFAYLPHSKLMHSILAPVVIAMNAVAEPRNEELYWPDLKKYREAQSPRG
jgi:nitrate reductase gamma subunit